MCCICSPAPLPSFHVTTSADAPRFAAHVWSPMTATALSAFTIWVTPGIFFAAVSSTEASVPPNTGQLTIAAYFMPGRRTSRPNTAVPSIFSGESMRFADVPTSPKSFGSLSGTFCGAGSFRGGIDEFTVADRAIARRVLHLSALGVAARRIDLPLLRRR